MARRLTENHDVSVLLLEAGGDDDAPSVMDADQWFTNLGTERDAIVTGASSGIGLEMVKRLIEKDYRVVANSRRITSAMTLHSTADLKLVDGDIAGREESGIG